MRVTRIVIAICFSLVVAPALGTELLVVNLLNQPADAELVDSVEQTETGPELVVLGALEKVNHELEPEASESVLGRKSSATWHLTQTKRTRRVIGYYQAQLDELGEPLFTCHGRSCGSSSYWANRVFEQAILYGPEQHQYYSVHRASDGKYVALYIGQRATRKVYVHLVVVEPTE